MTCECIEIVDKALASRNTRLALTIILRPTNQSVPTIQTEQVTKGRGKPRATTMLPTFCPFCGVKYEDDDPVPTDNDIGIH